MFRIHLHHISATHSAGWFPGLGQVVEKSGRKTVESQAPGQCQVSSPSIVCSRCWSGADSLPHHPSPCWKPCSLHRAQWRPPPEVWSLRPGHQLLHRAPGPGEAEDSSHASPHRGHDGPVCEGSAGCLAGPGSASQDRSGIMSGLQQTSSDRDPQVRLLQTRLSHGQCQGCCCSLVTCLSSSSGLEQWTRVARVQFLLWWLHNIYFTYTYDW